MSELKYKVGDRVKYDSEICTVTKVLESQGKFKYRVQSDTWFDVFDNLNCIYPFIFVAFPASLSITIPEAGANSPSIL